MARHVSLIILISVLGILIAGCASSGSASCKTAADCGPKKCQTAACTKNECAYTPKQNCCGNGIKDSLEDGKPGNSCTCPTDHGACDGKAQIAYGTSRPYDATYVKKYCSQQQCVMGVDPRELKPTTLLEEKKLNSFDIEVVASFNQPFRVPTDSFSFRITLKNAKEEVVYPIKFTHVTLREGEVLYGENGISATLEKIGDVATFNVPLIYHLSRAEEDHRITYKMDYEYTLNTQVRNSSGTTTVPKFIRESTEYRFATKIIFAQDGIS